MWARFGKIILNLESLDTILEKTTDIRDSLSDDLNELYDFDDTPYFQNAFEESISGMVYAGTKLTEELPKFGEDGSGGDLTVASGTTTISAASAKVLIRQYNNVTISGGTVAFSNPHDNGTIVILKVKNNFTMTGGTITLANMGAIAGTGGAIGIDGTTGSNGTSTSTKNAAGFLETGAVNGVGETGGAGGASNLIDLVIAGKSIKASCGAGGGGGGGGDFSGGTGGTGGNGGRGSGTLIIEIAGTLIFASGATITTAGTVG